MDEGVRQRVRQDLRHLQKEQNPTPPPPWSAPSPSHPEGPMAIGVDGFRSTAATVPGIRCNLCVRGSIHEDGAFRCNSPSQKLDFRRLGPFEIIDVVGESKAAFELKLPNHWRIHPIFHASLLDPYWANKIEGRRQTTPPPLGIVNGEVKYEVEAVLDSRI